jgi:hypothetical protein
MLYQLTWCGIFALTGFAILGMLCYEAFVVHSFSRYSFIDSILPVLVLFVLPAWVAALYLLTRVYHAVTYAHAATTPVLGFQSHPTPVWPVLPGVAVALLLLGIAGAWLRLDRVPVLTIEHVQPHPIDMKPMIEDGP